MSQVFPPRVRQEVWKRDNGDSLSGLCFVCNSPLQFVEAELGHIIARANGGGDELNNLKAICSSCNRSMKTQNLFDYKKKYYSAGSSRSSVDLLTDDLSSINLNDTETKRRKLLEVEMKKRSDKIKETEKQITDTEKQIIEMKKKIEKMQKDLLAEEKKISQYEKEITILRVPFCDKMNGNVLCMKVNCKEHVVEPLIDLIDTVKKCCDFTKKNGEKCSGRPNSFFTMY